MDSVYRQLIILRVPETLDHLDERLPLDVLHGVPAGLAVLAGAAVADQVMVVHPDDGLHHEHEPLEARFVVGELGIEDLERDILAGPGVAGLVDGAHAAPRQHRPEIIVRDRLAGEDTGVGPDRGVEGRLLLRPASGYRPSPRCTASAACSDLDLLPMLQVVLLDLLAVDECPADALQVGQMELAPLATQLAMEPAHGPIRQPRIGLLAAADRERGPLDQVEDATLFGARDHSQVGVHGEPPSGHAAGQGSARSSAWDHAVTREPGP